MSLIWQLQLLFTGQSVPQATNIIKTNMTTVHLLDYAAGNIRSLVNAVEKLGYHVEWITSPEDVSKAEVGPP